MPIGHAVIHVMHVTFCKERKEIVKNFYKFLPPSHTFFYPDAPRTYYYFLTEIKAKDLGSKLNLQTNHMVSQIPSDIARQS